MPAFDSNMFLRALRGLLRPLVRTLISRGISAPAFYKLLKAVYVEVAKEDFHIDGKITDSRISLLTGVHRRDVKSILENPDTVWEATRAKTTTIATVLGQWIAQSEYQTETGAPKPLPKTSESGESFESLVRLVNTDIRPRTVLDELRRQSLIVEDDQDGLLRIADRAVIGPASEDDKLVFFASNVGDHLAAASGNLLSDESPFYERAVFYNGLTSGSVDTIEDEARARAQALLVELNDKSSELQMQDRSIADPKERFRMGVYFYRESASSDQNGDEEEKDSE